jgi:hypothetical protein
MQHSTPKMKIKLLTMDSWAATSTAQDGIRLLKIIRDICHKKDGSPNAMTILDLIHMDKEMFLVHQGPTKLLSSYLSKFKGTVDVVKSSDGTPWSHLASAKIVFNKIYGSLATFALAKASNSSDYHAAVTKAKRRYLAGLFFHGLSNEAHRHLKKKVHNNALKGLDAPTSKSSSSRTSMNPPTSSTNLGPFEGGASPLHKRASCRQWRQWRRWQRRLLRIPPPTRNPTQSQGERMPKERCFPTAWERKIASTAGATITGWSTAPI